MTYNDAINKIHSLLQFGSRPGLDRMEKLLSLIGNPQDKMKFIHIAGTNGKGSVSTMLSSILTEAKYKTGLFVSPYIIDFRERIQINNEMVSEEIITEAVEYVFPFVEEMSKNDEIITEFEFVNALAFYIYTKEKCDIVVLETGMGGLLDSTNTIKPPLISVITPIALDHTAVLGDTIEEITAQKCGIIKKNSFVVCAKQSNEKITKQIEQDTLKKHSEFIDSTKVNTKFVCSNLSGTFVKYNHKELMLHLLGLHQYDNLNTVLATIELLKKEHLYDINIDDIDIGIHRAKNPARFEVMNNNPLIILDGAHNPNGMEAFSASTKHYVKTKNNVLLTGMLKDKDIKKSFGFLKGLFDTVITVPVDNPRAISPNLLKEIIAEDFNNITAVNSVSKGLSLAIDATEKANGSLLICGSLYLASQLRPLLLEKYK